MGPGQTVNFGLPWEKGYGYCQARRVGDLIFVSGQLSHDEKGNLIGIGDFEKQARQTYKNISKLLKKLGATMEDVVSDIVYITDMEAQAASMSRVHKEVYRKNPPTSTVVEVNRLYFKEQLIEVSAVAIAPKRKRRRTGKR